MKRVLSGVDNSTMQHLARCVGQRSLALATQNSAIGNAEIRCSSLAYCCVSGGSVLSREIPTPYSTANARMQIMTSSHVGYGVPSFFA